MHAKRFVCLLVLIVVSALGAPPLSACGDKFLALGRTMSRFQGFASVHPGVIAIYTRDTAAAAEAAEPLRRILLRAGHRVNIVNVNTLSPLVKASGVDIVFANVDESDAVRTRIDTTNRPPKVLYVASRGRGISRVTPVLKTDDTADKFLRVVEEAMKERTKAGAKGKP
jgi:hypothetical protein